MATNLEICDRLFAAIAAGDVDTVRALYAPNAVIWHNYDMVEQTAEQNLAVLRWVTRNIKGMRYEDSRSFDTGAGFVEQHVLRGTAPDGTPLEVPACVVVTIENGLITRLDEYLDTAQTAALGS